jgi:hypothetical protein
MDHGALVETTGALVRVSSRTRAWENGRQDESDEED